MIGNILDRLRKLASNAVAETRTINDRTFVRSDIPLSGAEQFELAENGWVLLHHGKKYFNRDQAMFFLNIVDDINMIVEYGELACMMVDGQPYFAEDDLRKFKDSMILISPFEDLPDEYFKYVLGEAYRKGPISDHELREAEAEVKAIQKRNRSKFR